MSKTTDEVHVSGPVARRQALVSVVIVSYNVREHLLDTLRALYASSGMPLEAIVVDNASRDGSADAVDAAFPKAVVLRNDSNLGFGRASNLGIEHSQGEFVLLLNPDVMVEPDCLTTLVGFMHAHPKAGAASPRLSRPDGTLDLAARRGFPTPRAAFYRVTLLSRLFPTSRRFNRYNVGYLPADEVHEIDAGTAACLMVRRSAIDQVGAFDPDYFMYGEDLDLCFRLKQSGWKVFYVPAAAATHVKGASSRQATSAMLLEFHRAMWIFHRKHYAANLPAPANWLIWVGIWSRWALLSLRSKITRDPTVSA
jgi:GT2 family glycosyltransferase